MDATCSLNPQKWKNTIKNNRISENLLFLNHHLIKCNILLSLEKLNSKEFYLIQLTRDFTAYLIGSIFM